MACACSEAECSRHDVLVQRLSADDVSSPHRRLIDKVSRIRVLTPAGIYYMRTFFWRQEVFREFAWLFRRENRDESWGYLSKSERRPVVRLLWTWQGRGGRRQDRAAGRILPPCAAGRDRTSDAEHPSVAEAPYAFHASWMPIVGACGEVKTEMFARRCPPPLQTSCLSHHGEKQNKNALVTLRSFRKCWALQPRHRKPCDAAFGSDLGLPYKGDRGLHLITGTWPFVVSGRPDTDTKEVSTASRLCGTTA
ncbi:Musculin [Anas platyrhynchos]|uniref:Musculin n=1 Tax=Anas platyrhynchos TaxID=8839 RepID=R0LI86_ANAPL|nr:Musculin [Anas platyrhynchos]